MIFYLIITFPVILGLLVIIYSAWLAFSGQWAKTDRLYQSKRFIRRKYHEKL
jgi:hypothetical protein